MSLVNGVNRYVAELKEYNLLGKAVSGFTKKYVPVGYTSKFSSWNEI